MKTICFVSVFLVAICVSVSGADAEFKVWAPINPHFVGGNPLNGQWLLNKEQATNEYADDKLERMMKELMTHIDTMTQSITDHIDNLNLTLSMPTVMQVGTGNTGVIGSSGTTGNSTSSGGALGNFKPSLGIE